MPRFPAYNILGHCEAVAPVNSSSFLGMHSVYFESGSVCKDFWARNTINTPLYPVALPTGPAHPARQAQQALRGGGPGPGPCPGRDPGGRPGRGLGPDRRPDA